MRIPRGLPGWAAAAVLAVVAAGWASADEKGETTLRQAYQTLHAAKSFTATITASMSGDNQTINGTVAAMKPNFLQVELKPPAGVTFIADGKNYFVYQGESKQYFKMPLAVAPTEFQGMWEGEIDSFFGGEKSLPKGTITSLGSGKVGTVDCDRVKVEPTGNGATLTYWIGKADHLIHRTEMIRSANGQSMTQTNTLSNIKLNAPKKAADFAFDPPRGAKLFEQPDYEAKLVPVGNLAPRFLAPAPTGGDVALTDALKGKKAVLVNFWFYG